MKKVVETTPREIYDLHRSMRTAAFNYAQTGKSPQVFDRATAQEPRPDQGIITALPLLRVDGTRTIFLPWEAGTSTAQDISFHDLEGVCREVAHELEGAVVRMLRNPHLKPVTYDCLVGHVLRSVAEGITWNRASKHHVSVNVRKHYHC